MDHLHTDLLKQRCKKISEDWQNLSGKCVVYVMSRDQRANDNHALLAAQKHALKMRLPLAVIFCLHKKNGFRAREHYEFMLIGLRQTEKQLKKYNIPLILLVGNSNEVLPSTFYHLKPAVVYFDFSPLNNPCQLQNKIAKIAPTIIVDTHNIVPSWHASSKQEFSARTFRPKIQKQLANFLVEPEELQLHPYNWPGKVLSLNDIKHNINLLINQQKSNDTKIMFESGELAALDIVNSFFDKNLKDYSESRNDPTKKSLSNISPYLHFGQISSLRVALNVIKIKSSDLQIQNSKDVLFEEMIVRKELSDNFCLYNSNYTSLAAAPEWAQITLKKHQNDAREFFYTKEQFEQASTHDPAWNAAQNELLKTGKMHGYMRMYWAKKVLEWSESPEQALNILIYLNDFYSIDGGDPNGYVGILWSVAGLHDRPWGERAVYGTVRSMVYSGLKRKFDIKQYETMWS